MTFDVGEVLGECPFPAGGIYMDQPGPWRVLLTSCCVDMTKSRY